MRYALPGSLLVHVAIFGAAFVGFAWPDAEDAPAPGAVTVDIVSMSSVSSNASSIIESSSTENLVSSGSEAVPPAQSPVLEAIEPEPVSAVAPTEDAVTPEAIDPVPPEPVQENSAVPAETAPAETTEAVDAEPVEEVLATAMLTADPLETVAPVPAQPLEQTPPVPSVVPTPSEVVVPETVTDAKVAPVPQTLSFERPSAPTPRQTSRPRQPQQQAAAEPPRRPASQAGNGGQSEADASATQASAGQGGAGAGGEAEVARWQSQVLRRLASALRYPRAAGGERGEVVVRFTVAQQGSASGVSIVRSSGNAVLDQAALETVGRAAPFPPIPANAGFASRTFDFPLGFVRN